LRGLSLPLIANIQGLKELGEGEKVDREVSPPILNGEGKEQPDSLHWVNSLLGCVPPLWTPHLRTHTPDSHLPLCPIPPDFWYPEGSQIPYLPNGDCPAVPSPLRSIWEVIPLYLLEEENNLVGRDMDKSMEEVSFPVTGRGLSGRAEPRR
jgi:hypothetical protein